ncbi:MAG: FAD-binding oxidoreductase, partial [Anaerolineae bacterium]|nr:FAD-binding oxidoreductase [Anaerolineae bacterium]
MKSLQADVVIVGAGVSGLSSAYELAKAGVDVLVVERGFLTQEQSGRNPGGIRQIGRDINEMPLIVAAMQRWHGLEEELGCSIELEEDGYLWVALSEQDLELQRGLVERDAPYGIKEFILDGDEVRKMAPAISDFVVGALYCPTDVIANPLLVASGYSDRAREYGARFLFGTEVVDLRLEGGRVRGVVTDQGEITADVVVNAAGPWSDRVGRMAGIDIPITPCPNQFILTEPMPPILPPFLVISSIAVCRQPARGHVYIGNTNAPGGISGYSKATDYGEMVRTTTNILKIVPAFRGLNVIRTWVGIIDFTPDDNFIFGRVEQVEGLIPACGFSGHGFALTPLIGQLMCELIVEGET